MYDGTYKQALVVSTACLQAMRKNYYRWEHRIGAIQKDVPAILDKLAEHIVEEFPREVKKDTLPEFYTYCSLVLIEYIEETEKFYQASNL